MLGATCCYLENALEETKTINLGHLFKFSLTHRFMCAVLKHSSHGLRYFNDIKTLRMSVLVHRR